MSLYGRILRSRHVAVLLLATTLSRLPFAINSLAVLLFLEAETGSFGVAGLTTGALALGGGLAAPIAARLVDRRGLGFLMPLAFVYSAAILALWALGEAGAPTALLALTAFVAGAGFPPTGAVLRSRWPELLDEPELIRGAYAFDSAMIEVSFVSGPLIVAGIIAVLEPQAALALAAALQLAGTALFVWQLPGSREPDQEAQHTGLLGALGAPAIRMIALTTLPVGFCIGVVEVAIPAFADEQGSNALSGILLALWSLASGIGGLTFGVRGERGGGLVRTYLLIALVFPLATLPMVVADSPAVMGALVFLSGTLIAPLIASRNELVAEVAPAGTGAEAFTWLMTALVAGLSMGAAVGGAVIEAESWQAAVVVGAVVAAAGAAFAVMRRDSLRPVLVTA